MAPRPDATPVPAGLSAVDLDRVDVDGGAVALTLAHELRRRGGVATLCGGGGQGEALLLEV